MGGVVEGAALGAAFQALITTVIDASIQQSHFKSRLDCLKVTLLLIDHQNYFNPSILPDEAIAFTNLIFKAQRLVRNCSRVKWNVFKRLYYAHKLRVLEASLLRFFQIDVAALHYAESKRISKWMSDLEDKIDEIAATLLNGSESIGLASSCEFTPQIMTGAGVD